MSIKTFFFTIILFISTATLCQKKDDNKWIPSVGENGEIIEQDSARSFKPEYGYAQFFVDSLTREPYTGRITIGRGIYGLTTIELRNGIQFGFEKDYSLNNDSLKLGIIGYTNPQAHISTLRFFRSDEAHAYYVEDTKRCHVHIKYRKNRTILKRKCGNERERRRFNSLAELREHLISSEWIDIFEASGFFVVNADELRSETDRRIYNCQALLKSDFCSKATDFKQCR